MEDTSSQRNEALIRVQALGKIIPQLTFGDYEAIRTQLITDARAASTSPEFAESIGINDQMSTENVMETIVFDMDVGFTTENVATISRKLLQERNFSPAISAYFLGTTLPVLLALHSDRDQYGIMHTVVEDFVRPLLTSQSNGVSSEEMLHHLEESTKKIIDFFEQRGTIIPATLQAIGEARDDERISSLRIDAIVVDGSYGRGDATAFSDIDILLFSKSTYEELKPDQIAQIREAIFERIQGVNTFVPISKINPNYGIIFNMSSNDEELRGPSMGHYTDYRYYAITSSRMERRARTLLQHALHGFQPQRYIPE